MRVVGAIAVLASLACFGSLSLGCAVATGDGESNDIDGAENAAASAAGTGTGSSSRGEGAVTSPTGDSVAQPPSSKTASAGDPDRPPPHPWMTAGTVQQASTSPSNPAPQNVAR